MSLRFVLGRTGTGKTRRCVEDVLAELERAPDGPPLVLLVPEQATFQTEQALLASGRVRGFARAQVLSFGRLAWRVLQETGGATRPVLGDLGKRMVLAALVERHRADLPIYGRLADRPGLAPRLAGALRELRAYRIAPETLRAAAAALAAAPGEASTLARKAHDLALVAEALEDYCAPRFVDPDVYLGMLVARMPASSLVRGAQVWLDGFAGFTPDELEVVGGLLRVAERVSVTLLLDAQREPDPRHLEDPAYLFRPSLETHGALVELAGAQGARLDPPVILDRPEAPHRFRGAPELAHLERRFFRLGPPPVFAGEAPRLALHAAPRRRDEVEAVARECLRLRREEHVRFREMALILRDLESYADLVEAVFEDLGIPVFVDRRRAIPHHPLVELTRAAVDAVLGDWPAEAVFRHLRTDLVPVERDAVDRLESYVLEHGIRGRLWYLSEPWRFVRRFSLEEEEREPDRGTAAELQRLDRERRRATQALAAFQRRVGASVAAPRPVRDLAEALYRLLEELEVPATLARWAEEATAAGAPEAAREHQQAWRGVVALLDELVGALGDQLHDLDSFQRVLEAGLESLDVGLIPPGLDQVVVGSIERSRHLGTRAAFVLGVTDRAFPPEPAEDPMLGDTDRERLAAVGARLGPSAKEQLFHESYFAYLTLTRASGWLWVSHPLADDEGRELIPSSIVRKLAEAFPGARRVATPRGEEQALEAARPRDLAAGLARELRAGRELAGEPSPRVRSLARWMAADPALRADAEDVFAAVDYEGSFAHRLGPLAPALARELFTEDGALRTSVSRLESFTACPFQHFARFGLRLAERPHGELQPADLGLLNHAVLSRFVSGLAERHERWAALGIEEARARLAAIVDQLAPRLRHEWVLEDPQHRYLLSAVRRVLDGSVELLGEHARRGAFEALAVELGFGGADALATGAEAGGDRPRPYVGELPALEIAGEGGLPPIALRGRIDRVDVFRDEHGIAWARVIDYKRRPRNITQTGIYHGLDLQLLTYLMAVTRQGVALVGQPVVPAGALYFPVHDPIQVFDVRPDEATADRKRRGASKMSGLVIDERSVVGAMGATAQGHCDLVPVRINQDDSVSRSTSVVSGRDFEHAFQHVERRVRAAAAGILGGTVAAAPFRLVSRQTACLSCRMSAVCQFDPAVVDPGYRDLPPVGRGELWTRLGEELDGTPHA